MKIMTKHLLMCTALLGCLLCTGCNKDEKNSTEVSTTTIEITTEALTTTEAPTTEVVTTESTTEEVITTEATTEAVVEERASYIVTDTVDVTTIEASAVEGSDTNPAVQGEWCQAYKSAGTDNPKQTLYFRVTDVKRGEDAQAIISDYEANDGDFRFGELEYDDLEYCVMTYQVYFPEGYLENDWGISFTNLSFHVVDGDNHGTIGNYIGMAQTYDISERVKNDTLYAGDVLERQMVFVMVKDYTDYMLYHRYYDDDSNIYTKYVACEAGTTEAPAETVDESVATEDSSNASIAK